MKDHRFEIVGIREAAVPGVIRKKPWYRGKPIFSGVFLLAVMLGCIFAELVMTKDPAYLDLMNCSAAPCREFLFGTDGLGRDIFSMIWYGGRISLFIGIVSTAVSTAIAIVFGSLSGLAPQWLDTLLMRLAEILLSVPNLLIVAFLQAILREASVLKLSLVIGLTGWMGIAKIVRTEVRQIRGSEYVIASRSMGGGFFHILKKHLTPNFISAIMFMVVMNIRSAIVVESTLSFMGIGLPIEIISWGSMLSLAEKAVLTKSWWIVLIPGLFLVGTLLSMTEIGDYLRKNASRGQISNI